MGCAKEKIPVDGENTVSAGQSADSTGLADCTIQFNQSKICLSWSWQTNPTDTDMGSLYFKTYRPNQVDNTPVQVDLPSVPQVVLWMPAMGHGSSPTTVEKLDVGTYQVNNVFFIMPGQWQIRFQLRDGNTVLDEASVNITR